MGKLRVMMRLWQGYALNVSLATSENEFLHKNKSEAILDIYMNKRDNLSLSRKIHSEISYVGLPIMKN